MRYHTCDGIVTGYERVATTTEQSYNIVPQREKYLITKLYMHSCCHQLGMVTSAVLCATLFSPLYWISK